MSIDFLDFSREFWNKLDLQQKVDNETFQITEPPVFDRSEIITRIEDAIVEIVHQLSVGDVPSFQIRSRRSWENVFYEPNVGLQVEDDAFFTTVSLSHESSVEKFGLMMKVLSMIYKLLQHGRVATKRDLFYEEPHLFRSQSTLDHLVDDIACMLQVPRRCLNVVATSKGVMAGDLTFVEDNGERVDCSVSAAGILVPSQVDSVSSICTKNAKFILVVEKDATFQHLLDDHFTERLPCILITGKGIPDVNVRLMIRKIRNELQIPVFGLMDADPYGIEIMFVYKYGSMSQAWDANNLALPFMHWIGIHPSDITRLQLGEDSLIPLTNRDESKLRDMLLRPYVSGVLSEEINQMLSMRVKAEIQALNRISSSYLGQVFIPRKIKHGKWI